MIIAIMLFLAIIACISFFGSLHFTGFRLLYLISRWNFYFSAILAVISYYIFSTAINAGCAETIDAIHKRKYSWQRGIGSVAVFILLAYYLVTIAGLLWCSYKNDGTDYFVSILPRAYAINILLPQLILIGISYIASCVLERNKLLANSILIAMLLLTSPLLEKLIWREKPQGFPIDTVVGKIRDLFGIFYQNAEWAPDTQYGLQTENMRLFLQLFWIFLILAFLLWTCGGRRGRQNKVAGALCTIIAVAMGVLSYAPASIYRQDESWNGIFADLAYYEEDGIAAPVNEQPDYSIEKYDMSVKLKNQLRVSGKLQLKSPVKRQEFVLTLYHGYEVKNIKAENMELSYERNKDKIILRFPQEITECTLEIEYAGHSGKYYSNSQAVMLPGYFPWYPMAGDRQVFVQYPYYNGGNGYNPYNRVTDAEFHLEISANCDFVTNLEAKGGNVFEGNADSVSIIGGKIKETTDVTFINYLPLELNGSKEQKYLENVNQVWNQTLTELTQVFGIDTDALKEKKIIMVSKDMGRNFTNNYLVEFDDYIVCSAEYLDSPTYINYLLQKTGKESQIGNLFAKAILLSDTISAEAILEKMLEDDSEFQQLLSQIEADPTDGKIGDEEIGDKEIGDEEIAGGETADRLELLKGQIDADTLVREIVQYLLNPDMETDDDFFDSLVSFS